MNVWSPNLKALRSLKNSLVQFMTSSPSVPETLSAEKSGGKNAMIFVLLTVMINSIGFGIMIPVLPDLLKELSGLGNSDAVIHGGYLTLVFAVMQFIAMPVIGALSDSYGRRPVMLFSLFGLALDYFIMGFAPTLAFLYLGRIIAGGTAATFSTANAYIADISPPETRAQTRQSLWRAFITGQNHRRQRPYLCNLLTRPRAYSLPDDLYLHDERSLWLG